MDKDSLDFADRTQASHKIKLEQCLEAGFTNAAYLDPQKLEFLPDIRQMCEANRCGLYGRCWVCPPACGTLEELEAELKSYPYGVLLQVTGEMEDSFDYETIEKTKELAGQALVRLTKELTPLCGRLLSLSAGGCRLCGACAYPDSPCRHPGQASFSLEACGLFVSRECEKINLPYYYGPNTMTFTAAVMIEER